MARIPNNELDRLKHEVALVSLVESSGIELKKHGKGYLGLCPVSRVNYLVRSDGNYLGRFGFSLTMVFYGVLNT